MSEQTNSTGVSNWIYVVIVLVAIIGLLAGLLISKATTPEPVLTVAQVQTDTPVVTGTDPTPRPPANPDATQQDISRIVRNLSRERRREVLQQAMKNVEKSGYERPRVLMENRQQARRKSFEIARTEPFDAAAMRKAIEEVNKINQEMVNQGTDLTIEVLQLMTPAERKAATQRRPMTRRERVQQRRENRRQRRNQD
ncbi:MAG: periplasmic heavy metal sensor [Acidimicrobiales bacterium]|nr:periplasmic heavy metal sensor [Hyphomonadaceae bacterium]RZV39111.1 MAG: periplasmic heavy metal sensor [Acidimicrobiales bacterium]